MFGLTDEQLLSKGIKIIDGIAGGGKSSKIDNFFKSRNINYSRYTSTNRLRRDAMERYAMPVKTIAAGLFVNRGLHFYAEEKDPTSEYVVIDEILQADPKAIEWCINHADTTDIIITTDSKQLLSPENEAKMTEVFTKLRMRPDVTYVNITDTLRPRNEETKKYYNIFYGIADLPKSYTLRDLRSMFPNVIPYEEMEYNHNDAYITHDNLTEDFLYKDVGFASLPDLDLIPKGCLSSKPPSDLTKYPVLSQLQANKTNTRSYTQVMNVGSPVRFQGSEIISGQKLYFIIQPSSVVTARELYTVITRMWDIDSFVIVVCNTPSDFTLTTFHGKPVKTHRYLSIEDEVEETKTLSASRMDKICSEYDTNDIYYDRDRIIGKGGATAFVRTGASTEAPNKRKSTAGSLARRDAALKYSYMDSVYAIFDKHGIDHARAIHKHGKHTDDNFELDFANAHPTMLKYEKMPADGFIQNDEPHDNMLNFYLYEGDHFTNKSVITDDMANYIKSHDLGTVTYLFSTPYVTGTFPGEWLYNKTHNTVEDKKDIKSSIHYGYYQKPYLKLSLMGDCYVRYENYIYELLICQIFSQIMYYMMLLYDLLNGTSIIVDAVRFPCYNESMIDEINKVLPSYIEYRIRINDKNKEVLYMNYQPLLTKKDKEKSRKKSWYANLTPEQKAEKNRRERERRAKRKEINNVKDNTD